MRLIIRTDAEADIAQAHDWYERQRVGLGAEFLEEISATIEAVHSAPLRFPATFRALRRALVHRFPCAIFFVVRSDAVIVVAGLASRERSVACASTYEVRRLVDGEARLARRKRNWIANVEYDEGRA